VDRPRISREQIFWLLAAAAVAAAILAMTLVPDGTPNQRNLVPLWRHINAFRCLFTGCEIPGDGWWIVKDVTGNVAVFIPVGIVFAGLQGAVSDRRRFLIAVLLGAGFSGVIELIQSTIPTRATDVDDVLFNTIGSAVGAALFIWFDRRFRRESEGPG
jgi:glycopeptide antibiotics resistance protein